MEGEIGGHIADLMLRILRIVASEERPGTLTVLAMDVFDPGRARLLGQHRDAGSDCITRSPPGRSDVRRDFCRSWIRDSWSIDLPDAAVERVSGHRD